MDSKSETTVTQANSNGGFCDAGSSTAPSSRHIKPALTEEMLASFAARAGGYDQQNRFFTEDFEELRATKYLLLPLPAKFGGADMSLAEVCRQQRRLAYHAPATALAVNMHLYWLGVAADLWHRGDTSLEWILGEAAAGENFFSRHGAT